MDKKADNTRGSDRMFEMDMQDTSAISEAIGSARGDYEVAWWWKYGTPALIDHIRGGLNVRPDRIGQTLEQLLKLNKSDVQVSARVFPKGLTNPDVFQVELEMRRSPGG